MRISFILVLFLSLFIIADVRADFQEYGSNPYTFSIQDSIWGYWSCFFVVDLNGDGLLDFTYRSRTKLYAYDHYGDYMWPGHTGGIPIAYPGPYINNHCTKHSAADVDGDGQMEIVALNASNFVIVYNGLTGDLEDIFSVAVGSYQIAGHVAIVNLRGLGDRDIIVQTMDTALEGSKEYYVNRTLIAYRLDTHAELWRVEQDRNTPNQNSIYEGYWGPAHGSFRTADIDNDGRDEVVGANIIDHNGHVISKSYPTGWLGLDPYFIDHLDFLHVGDFRPDLPGLEWIVGQEDHVQGYPGETEFQSWYTTMIDTGGILWRKKTTLFRATPYEVEREPQNGAVGNFSAAEVFSEVWLSSRGPIGELDHQHPWVFNSAGTQIADYSNAVKLPAGFNTHPNGNKEGIEPIFTIDWFGEKTDQIAAAARHVDGNIGVFNAMTGDAYWTTTGSSPPMAASMIYVADVAGDAREEVIVFDMTDLKIKIFWNDQANPNQPKLSKWSDPLYRRIKQNWNYYQPASYTYGDYPLISNIQIQNLTTGSATITWTTDIVSDSQVEYGETAQYGNQTTRDPALVTAHSVPLSGLNPYTVYHFRVKSIDAYGKIGFSADNTFQTQAILLSVKAFLEGPYRSPADVMTTSLNDADQVPFTSPYTEDAVTAASIPDGTVDWILIQIRTRADSATILSKSVFLKNDGKALNPDNASDVIPLKAHSKTYYVIVRNRNHLGVMSATKIGLSGSAPTLYDFTSAENKTYGSGGSKQLKTGLWGLWAGDVNRDTQVTTLDYTAWYNAARAGESGYKLSDVNFDVQVTTMDYTIWYNNARLGASSKIP